MKTNRVLQLPQGSKAYWLTKTANDAQIENILKRLHDSIYRMSACVDFGSESFTGGVSSGIAIAFKLSGMEQRAGKIEAEMKKALQRRVEILCGVASLKLGEEVFREIEIDFQRNVPADLTNLINQINALRGLVSDATLLAQIPFIDDVELELEKVAEQKQSNVAMFGNNLFDDSEDATEEDENDFDE
jgi:SPP1 family phage portal protein